MNSNKFHFDEGILREGSIIIQLFSRQRFLLSFILAALCLISISSARYTLIDEDTDQEDLKAICKANSDEKLISSYGAIATGIPAISDNESWETGALSKDESTPSVSSNERKREEIRERVEPDHPDIFRLQHNITINTSCERCIEQVSLIYDYLLKLKGPKKEGWSFVNDPPDGHYAYANETLSYVNNKNRTGTGDCDDFAILMSSLVESIGCTTRIISSKYNSIGHAYAEVYLGRISNSNTHKINEILSIADWLRDRYDAKNVFLNIEGVGLYACDVWLNLDWKEEEGDRPHPGGPYFPYESNAAYNDTIRVEIIIDESYQSVNPQPLQIECDPDKAKLKEEVICESNEIGQWYDNKTLVCSHIDSCAYHFSEEGTHKVVLKTDHNRRSQIEYISISR